MSLLSSTADGVGLAGARANQIVLVGDNGAVQLAPNLPCGQLYGHYSEFENGAAGQLAQGLHAWTAVVIGAGAQRVALTAEPGWFQNAGSIETGTTTTGVYMLWRSPAGIVFSSTSGQWVYECTFSIPVLSDGTNTYQVLIGFFDSFTSGSSLFHGAALVYTHSLNSGKFQFVTANGAVLTSTDTGVTLVAGNYYHARIEIQDNTVATCYLKTTFSGGSWSDDGVWSSPVATNSTNVPTGATFKTFPGLYIQKSAGTTSRLVKIGYQAFHRSPTLAGGAAPTRFVSPGRLTGGDGVGVAAGSKATALSINSLGVPAWIPPLRLAHPFVFYAYGRGGWLSSPPHDFGYTVGGSGGGGGVNAAAPLNNNLFGATNMNSGFGADSYAVFHTSISLRLDASVQPMVLESAFSITSLSASGQQTASQFGLVDNVTGAIVAGVWVEFDAAVNAAAQCKTRTGGLTTTTSSGVTIAANTTYIVRIVITSTSVSFWVRADDAAAFGSPVAVITTNIPTANALAVANVQRNLAGATGRVMLVNYSLAYQRSTT